MAFGISIREMLIIIFVNRDSSRPSKLWGGFPVAEEDLWAAGCVYSNRRRRLSFDNRRANEGREVYQVRRLVKTATNRRGYDSIVESSLAPPYTTELCRDLGWRPNVVHKEFTRALVP